MKTTASKPSRSKQPEWVDRIRKSLRDQNGEGWTVRPIREHFQLTVRFDDGDERLYDYDKHPIERTIANDNEYVEQCNNTIDFMDTLDLSEAMGAEESE